MMRRRAFTGWVLAGVVLLLLGRVPATAAEGVEVRVAENARYGWILTDADGMSLYVYIEDVRGEPGPVSNCTGPCTRNWPPLAAGGEVLAGGGVQAALLGTLQRDDGTIQVTYGGWPLYRYVRDAGPGDVRGQKLGGVFFLISPAGEIVTEEVLRVVEVDPELFAALMAEGERVFGSTCAVCHGREGEGLVGPRLAANSAVGRSEFIIGRILDGFPEHGMPAWRDVLSDRQIAAVATFVRNAWSNAFGAVTEEEVAAMR